MLIGSANAERKAALLIVGMGTRGYIKAATRRGDEMARHTSMIDSDFTRAELDEAASLITSYIDCIENFAGWSYMISVEPESYRFHARLFLAAYRAVTNDEPAPFPVGSCIYIDRDGDSFRLIAEPAFGDLGYAIMMGPDPFVDTSNQPALWRLAAKFFSKLWIGEDHDR